jgi:hypothetical protein
MSRPPEVPAWCRVRRGGGALLLVAPHGGARQGPARGARPLKVNDLHTAALADELATALDASLIANPTLDRNELDLNRISQVARAAPWFLALLESLLAHILDRHPRAEVLFLHGWNTLQPKCDIGIGQALAYTGDAAAHAPALTTSVAYATTRLAALRSACAARGIAAPLGERYPAQHANNMLQLFRRDGAGALSPRLQAWVGAGRVDAVQLELAAPLRWPGPLRSEFIAVMRDAFGAPAPPSARAAPVAAAAPRPPAPRQAMALQAYDPGHRLGVLARVDPHGRAGASGRLLLFLDGGAVALFTGEEPQAGDLARSGPRFCAAGDRLRLTFDGWALRAADGALYVDLERALAASHLIAVRADLTFAPRAGDCGRVHGTLTIDDAPHMLEAVGFALPGGLGQPHDTGWRSHLILRAALSDGSALALRHRVPGGTLLDRGAPAAPCRATAGLHVTFDSDPEVPRRIVAAGADGEIVAMTTARMAIVRPLSAGRRARVTLGISRVVHRGAEGYGFFEYARVL